MGSCCQAQWQQFMDQCLAQRHFDMWTVGAGTGTDPPFGRWFLLLAAPLPLGLQKGNLVLLCEILWVILSD